MRWVALAALVAACGGTAPVDGDVVCDARSAELCVLRTELPGYGGRACTDGGHGPGGRARPRHDCVLCQPVNPALDLCLLDGTSTGTIDGLPDSAGTWTTCVADCRECTPAEALALDPAARCVSWSQMVTYL